jgi:transcriptional regulator with XRE-family HTH domain
MPDSFGARLRQRREQQQVALSTIAEQTKIKQSLLDGLERDDVSQWPSGIFRRAFVRTYAHAIGLDPDTVVREFLQLYPDPAEDVATVPAEAQAGNAQIASGAPPMRLRYLVGSAIGSLSGLRVGAAQRGRALLLLADRAHINAVASKAGMAADGHGDAEVDALPAAETGAPIALEPCAGGAQADNAAAAAVDDGPAGDSAPVPPLGTTDVDWPAAAHLCTCLGRLHDGEEFAPLLQEAARLLDAAGLIVWACDARACELTPVLAYGYSDRVLAQLPRVRRDADNATGAAFRSAQTCVVKGSALASGALVVPLLTAGGCAGVLSMEMQHGSEQREPVRVLATIIAAQLARLVDVREAEAADRRLA